MLFRDRKEAGRRLAERLLFLEGKSNVLVLGIPRGGVVVAAEVAQRLAAPLDIFIAHKIGAPVNPELAIGALTSNGDIILDQELIDCLQLRQGEVKQEIERQREELGRRAARFRQGCPPLEIADKIVVLVDDGVATGSTMLASLRTLRKNKPERLILAVPVGPQATMERLGIECDQTVVVGTPEPFWSVGRFYAHFGQTEDETVIELLKQARDKEAGDR